MFGPQSLNEDVTEPGVCGTDNPNVIRPPGLVSDPGQEGLG